MISPRVVLLRDVLEEHLEELQFLWSLRRDTLLSPERTRRDLVRLESRIDAHAEGLLVARGDLFDLVGADLASDDPSAAFAAGLLLLRSGRAGARAVVNAFRISAGGGRQGLSEALAYGDVSEVKDDLAECASSANHGLAVAAASVLARQRMPGLPDSRDSRFLEDPDPRVRLAGWRLVPFRRDAPRGEAVRKGIADEDSTVAREAVVAAAWFSMPVALDACRERVRSEGGDAGEWLRLLAVLGDASYLSDVLSAVAGGTPAGRGAAGPRALGALGHCRGVDLLLETMRDEDPVRSAAAGTAFLKVTGFDADSGERAVVREAGAPVDAFDEEFLDEVILPDAEKARAFWSSARGEFAGGTRWCRGVDVSAGCPGEIPATFDLESRWEVRLRGRFTGTWKGEAPDQGIG